jgi:hypothetical protein
MGSVEAAERFRINRWRMPRAKRSGVKVEVAANDAGADCQPVDQSLPAQLNRLSAQCDRHR